MKAYKDGNYKTSYCSFQSIAYSNSDVSDDSKFYLAKHYEKEINDYKKAFEFYLDICTGKPQNFKGTEKLLIERVQNNMGGNDRKNFEFYKYLFKNNNVEYK
ncbi:7924_t:CDS:2, partial [Cetraspora pellucida]